MSFSRAEVERLARLARLRLTEEEAARIAWELGSILRHLEVLEGSQAGHPHPDEHAAAPLRPDRTGADPLREPISAVAPAWADGYFVVPRPPAVGPAGEG